VQDTHSEVSQEGEHVLRLPHPRPLAIYPRRAHRPGEASARYRHSGRVAFAVPFFGFRGAEEGGGA